MPTPGYRFLASPRWLGLIAGALVAAAVCVFLGQWQYGRYEQRAEANSRVASAEASEPRPVTEVTGVGAEPAEDDEWTRVTATGTYDANAQIFVRGRVVGGATGWEVVVPLILDDGSALLVDRGWVAPGDGDATQVPDVPPVPSGVVTVSGRIRPGETAVGQVTTVDGVLQARRINPEQLGGSLAYPVLGGYVTPDEPEEGFEAIPVPQERDWQNFVYAYQWWLFGLLIPIGLVVLARREARSKENEDAEGAVPSTA